MLHSSENVVLRYILICVNPSNTTRKCLINNQL